MKEIILDGKFMTTKFKLHEEIKNKLNLPDFYGNNLDALWDMLTGYVLMPLTIVFINFNVCKRHLGYYADDLLFVFNQVENEMNGFKIIVKREFAKTQNKKYKFKNLEIGEEDFCEKYFIERKGTNSAKWDNLKEMFGKDDLIPMWVADMDFKSPDSVKRALKKRIDHGVYGYSVVPDSFYESFINWEEKHHNYSISKEWIRLCPGVVPAIYWFVNAFTDPKDSIIVLAPVYYPFQDAVKDTNRNLIMCELENDDGYYFVDYERFEREIKENKVKMFIHSSPHNPVGRVWSEDELDKLFKICKDNEVLIISDEIHQDIVLNGYKHIPSGIVKNGYYANNLITITSASKTFNLAGLSASQMVIENPKLRKIYDEYVLNICQTGINLMGTIATEAAYTGGESWLMALIKVIEDNYEYVKKSFDKYIPKAVLSPLEGTYLLWIDLRNYIDKKDVKEFIQDKCNIAVDFGEWFSPLYEGFIRLNIATHPKYVKFAVKNIIETINSSVKL